jgi:hypothetical protein
MGFVIKMVWLDPLEFLAAKLRPKGPGYYEDIQNIPSINNNTKPLCSDIKPYSLYKFIYGLIQFVIKNDKFLYGVWQLLGFVGNLENGVWDKNLGFHY